MLWQSMEAAGGMPRLAAACRALRDALGPGQTVFGVKNFGGRLRFEFYFYDYARLQRAVSITRVRAILAPLVRCALPPLEGRPYFMFSIDLDEEIVAGERPLDTINIYIGNPGSSVSSGICYEQSASGLRLANLYYFFDARREMDDVAAKVGCSVHHDLGGYPLNAVLRPELLDCAVIVVANKRFGDGVYFSRIPVAGLIGFVEQERFPSDLVAFVRDHRDDLDHLLYDVGIDYVVEAGMVRVTKSAFYGLL
ncbi:MAG TPA: hypothetical protein VJR70_02340 [Stellaceae bacterium]|nr:hypothetical protein [Stellaceae bacterium]